MPTNPIPRLGWVEVEIPAELALAKDPYETPNNIYDEIVKGPEYTYDPSIITGWLCKIETSRTFTNNCFMRVITRTETDKNKPLQRFITFYNAFIYDEEYNSEFTIYL